MHVAIDASNVRQGGGLTHLTQLLNAANPAEAGITQITIWACSTTAAQLPLRSWLIKRSPAWTEAGLFWRMFGQQFFLKQEISRLGCDLLFSPGGTIPFHLGLPVIVMSQNLLPFEPDEALRFGCWSPMRLKMWVLRLSQGWSFKRAQGVIFLTEYARSAILDLIGPTHASSTVISHGIESRFMSAPRAQRRLEDCSFMDPFRLLYVSILMPYKHQVEVAKAVCALRSKGIPVSIQFAGEGWGHYGCTFGELLEHLDPRGEYLRWSGAVPFDQLHRDYQQADAFVFASSCENLPNILLEAMAAGLPIACSNMGPMREVLGDAGLYFDPTNEDSIAETIVKLASSPEMRSQLAALSFEKSTQYSWQVCAKLTFDFIMQVFHSVNQSPSKTGNQ